MTRRKSQEKHKHIHNKHEKFKRSPKTPKRKKEGKKRTHPSPKEPNSSTELEVAESTGNVNNSSESECAAKASSKMTTSKEKIKESPKKETISIESRPQFIPVIRHCAKFHFLK